MLLYAVGLSGACPPFGDGCLRHPTIQCAIYDLCAARRVLSVPSVSFEGFVHIPFSMLGIPSSRYLVDSRRADTCVRVVLCRS